MHVAFAKDNSREEHHQPEEQPLFWKGTGPEKKSLRYLSFVGNPVAMADLIRDEKEVDSAWLKQRKRWSTIGKYGRGEKKLQLHFILVKADIWGIGKNLLGSEMGFRRSARNKHMQK